MTVRAIGYDGFGLMDFVMREGVMLNSGSAFVKPKGLPHKKNKNKYVMLYSTSNG